MKKMFLAIAVIIVAILCFENVNVLRELSFYNNLRNPVVTFVSNAKKSIEEADNREEENKILDKQAQAFVNNEFSKYKVTINNDVYTIRPGIFTGPTALPQDARYGREIKRQGFAYVKVNVVRNGEEVKVDNLQMVQFPCEYKDNKFIIKEMSMEERNDYLRGIYDAIIRYDYEITLLENGIDKPFNSPVEQTSDLVYTPQGDEGSIYPYITGINEKYKYSYHVNIKNTEITIKRTKIK